MGHAQLVYNHGDGEAPYVMGAAFPDASSKVVELLMAMRSSEGDDGNKSIADLVNTTSWANLAGTARGWTVTLSNDTTSVSDTANGSVGNAAKVSNSTNVGVMLRRARITRTTLLDSLRGREYVLLRLRTSAASKWEVQLRWSQSLAEPATVSNLAVTHDTSAATSFGYVEIPVGFIEIPEDPNATLVGVALEVWARRLTGTGDLFMDFVRLLPATPGKDVLTKVMVPAGGQETWLGSGLSSPPYKLTADPTWTAGAVSGTAIILNAANEAAGVAPNTGMAWPAGRHRLTYEVNVSTPSSASGSLTYKCRVVSVGGGGAGSEVAAISTIVDQGDQGDTFTHSLEFDSVGGTSYQPQVNVTAADAQNEITVLDTKHEFMPATGQNETLRADPSRNLAEKLGSDGGHFLDADVKGPVPFWIPPGLAAVFAVPFDAPKANYSEPESVKARTLTLSATGAPRYYQ